MNFPNETPADHVVNERSRGDLKIGLNVIFFWAATCANWLLLPCAGCNFFSLVLLPGLRVRAPRRSFIGLDYRLPPVITFLRRPRETLDFFPFS